MSEQEPNSCELCGIPERSHSFEWSSAAGYHYYVQPSDEVRLKRMKGVKED